MNKEIIKKFGLKESQEVWGYSFELGVTIYIDDNQNRFSMYNPHACQRSMYISIFMIETRDFLFVTEEWALDPHWTNIKDLYNYEKDK